MKMCKKALVPSIHPQHLRTLGHKHGKLYIEWDPVPPIWHNGRGFHYSLHTQRLHGQQETEIVRKIEGWFRKSFEMSVAFCYEPYRISIKSVNNVGESTAEPTSIIGYSYEDTPTIAPINFSVEEASDTYVIFIWNFDRSEIGKYQTRIRGEFKGFKVLFWEETRPGTITLEEQIGPEVFNNLTGNVFSVRLESLPAKTTMVAQIAVINNYYTGSPSEPIKFTTKFEPEPQKIKTACQNIQEAGEHQNVTLVCDTTGKPRPTVTWYKNGVQIQGGHHNILLNGSLVITSVTSADSGEYTCEARNQVSSITAKCTLTVKLETAKSNSGNVLKFTHFVLVKWLLLYKVVGL